MTLNCRNVKTRSNAATEAALQASDDDEARYHLREALQLRIAEKSDVTSTE